MGAAGQRGRRTYNGGMGAEMTARSSGAPLPGRLFALSQLEKSANILSGNLCSFQNKKISSDVRGHGPIDIDISMALPPCPLDPAVITDQYH